MLARLSCLFLQRFDVCQMSLVEFVAIIFLGCCGNLTISFSADVH
jgi:hypothetical protein